MAGVANRDLRESYCTVKRLSGAISAVGDTVGNDLAPARRDIATVVRNYVYYLHKSRGANMAFSQRMAQMPRAEVLHALRAMGHGDMLILSDANFPSDAVAQDTVLGGLLRIDRPMAEVARAVLSVLPLDTFVDDFAGRMLVVDDADAVPEVQREVQEVIAATGETRPMVGIERFAFYDLARQAYAVIQTGERRFYGCIMLRKGVIGPDE